MLTYADVWLVCVCQGSNTRFAEWLPHDDILITEYKLISSPLDANPKAIKAGGPPLKVTHTPY
jgi:hypothetical protein